MNKKYVLYCDQKADTLILTENYEVIGYTESINSDEILAYFGNIRNVNEISKVKKRNVLTAFNKIFEDFKMTVSEEEVIEYESFLKEVLPKGDILLEFTM